MLFRLIVILMSVLLVSNCEKSESDNNIRISDDASSWLLPFSMDDEMSTYSSSTGLTANVSTLVTTTDNIDFFADCQVDGMTRQCQFLTAAFDFISPDDSTDYNISIAITAPSKLWLMPASSGGLSTPICTFENMDKVFEEGFPTSFNVRFDNDFNYRGIEYEAIILDQINRLDFWWGITLPKKIVLVKNIGIVEWEDFSGNIFLLN